MSPLSCRLSKAPPLCAEGCLQLGALGRIHLERLPHVAIATRYRLPGPALGVELLGAHLGQAGAPLARRCLLAYGQGPEMQDSSLGASGGHGGGDLGEANELFAGAHCLLREGFRPLLFSRHV